MITPAQTLILDATGFRVVFDNMEHGWENYWYPHVAFYTAFKPDLPLIEMDRVAITTRDFVQFANYLKNHLQQMSIDDDFESPPFITLETSFQAQAFSGGIDEAGEGGFMFQFHLNIGHNPIDRFSVYVGGQAEMNVKKAQEFIASIEALFVV